MRPFVPLALLVLALGLSAPASAQITPGNCTLGNAQRDLDINNVRARMYNNGNLFWRGGDPIYIVPQSGTTASVFAGGVWIGGRVNGNIRIAAARYGNYEFWPGPLNDDGTLPNAGSCNEYDRLYKVSRGDVLAYEAGNGTAADLRDWPYQLGAPVIDGDGDPTNYNLAGGDRPDLIGDQAIWWIMNDVGNTHDETSSEPIGMEVRVQAFAFGRADALNDVTFYKYTLEYKGNSTFSDIFLGIFSDPDLGNEYTDDYIGSNPELGIGYVYNADNEDAGGFGTPPPALGYDFLQGPLANAGDGIDNDNDGDVDEEGERLQMTRFGYYNNGSGPDGDPGNAQEYYRVMTGFWRDGQPWTEGGNARGGTTPVNFVYPGDAANQEYWSEFCTSTDCSTANAPDDRRFVLATGPFTMEPGDVQEIVYAIVWARGADNLNSVSAMFAADELAQTAYDLDFALPPPPPAPRVAVSEFSDTVILTWSYDPSSPNYLGSYNQTDPLCVAAGGDDCDYEFEGYNIYRFDSPTDTDPDLVATYDLATAPGRVIDQRLDPVTGQLAPFVAANGSNSGVQYTYEIDGLTNYQDYYYGVSAYAYNEESTPMVLESNIQRVTVRPVNSTSAAGGTIIRGVAGDTLATNVVNQAGEGVISARIVDPSAVQDATYRVVFRSATVNDETATVYDVVRLNADGTQTVVFDGADAFQRTGTPPRQVDNVLTIDGISFSIAGPEGALVSINDISPSGTVHTMIDSEGTLALNSISNPPRFIFSANGAGSAVAVLSRTDWTGAVAERAPIDYEIRFVENPAVNGQILINRQWDHANPAEAIMQGYLIADEVTGIYNADEVQIGHEYVNEQIIMHPNGRFPFQVWEVSPDGTERQVAAAILDDPEEGGAPNLIWDPSANSSAASSQADYGFGSEAVYERIYVRDSEYDDALFASDPAAAFDQIWNGEAEFQTIGRALYVPYGGHSLMPTPGTIVRYTTTKPNLPGDTFEFSTAGQSVVTDSSDALMASIDEINVVPNPYRGFSGYEAGGENRVVRFVNLPDRATIRIFTVAGTLVRTLQANSTRDLDWDLNTEAGLPVASGMYLIHIEAMDSSGAVMGERVLKFGVAQRQIRFDNF